MAKKCDCVLEQHQHYVGFDGMREIVGEEAINSYAKRHKRRVMCKDCGGVVVDYRSAEAQGSDLRQRRNGSRTRAPRQRIPVIRSLNGGDVAYRFFGESHGLKELGVDFSRLEGFKGDGQKLARELKMPIVDVAKALKVDPMEFMTQSFDISKD